MNLSERLSADLDRLRASGALRGLPQVPQGIVNLSGNDYLGLLECDELRESFYETLAGEARLLSAASSRLLTGSGDTVRLLERELAKAYGAEAALVFGSGYHANTGILPALTGPRSMILADKLSHASMIDGIRASGCKFLRYRHNDLAHTRQLLERYAGDCDEVFVMTESVFSMDGDRTNLQALVQLKRDFPNVILYLDEAHGVGVFGDTGLGCAHEAGLHREIDILIGTLGKAFCSTGAYAICTEQIRDWLVNRVRPFIFTTALPPVNLAWTRHVLHAMPTFGKRRAWLRSMGRRLADEVRAKGVECVSDSQIVPYIIGSNQEAIAAAERLQAMGFYVLPIRPPTVPEGTSRLRFSLTAALSEADFNRLLEGVRA